MPVWCPKCNSMLAEGLEKCPVCGARLPALVKDPPGGAGEPASPPSRSETITITAYLLSVLLIPVIVLVIIGLICAMLVNTGN
jgi:hypothetical protein